MPANKPRRKIVRQVYEDGHEVWEMYEWVEQTFLPFDPFTWLASDNSFWKLLGMASNEKQCRERAAYASLASKTEKEE